MDEYSNLPTISLEILIKTDADGEVRSFPPGLRFGLFEDFTTLLPPSYVHWWTYYCQVLWTFLTHIQAANSRQNHYPRYRSRTGIPDDPECFGNTTGIRYKNRETRPMPFEVFLFLFFQIPQCFFSHTNENRDSAGKDLTCTSAVVLIRISNGLVNKLEY